MVNSLTTDQDDALRLGRGKRFFLQLFSLSLVYNSILLFHEKIPATIVAIVSFIFVVLFFAKAKQLFSATQSIFLLIIMLVPGSFISVVGTDYGSLPISWFNLAICGLFAVIIRRNKINKWFLISLLLFVVFSLVSLTIVEHPLSAIKQIINIFVFLFSFVIGAYFLKHEWSKLFLDTSKNIYLQATVVFAVTVIIQYFFINATGEIVGHYGEYALGRISFAGLMGDFSFASLYIATGCIGLLFAYSGKRVKHFFTFLIGAVILMSSMIIVNARTGLFALAVAVILGTFIGFIRGNKKAIITSVIASVVIAISGLSIYTSRGDQSFTDGSSREDGYSLGFQVFAEHPLMGIGFGDDNYGRYLGDNPLPHNFFVQYLMQGGIIGLMIILSSFILFFRLPIAKDTGLWLALVAVFFGAMLIPDILNSRYLFVMIVLSIIGCGSYINLKKDAV
jgi:O-antigen ligase